MRSPAPMASTCHHLYQAMASLGEELPGEDQNSRTPFAPRSLKDVVEPRWEDHRRDLLARLDSVSMNTTSLTEERMRADASAAPAAARITAGPRRKRCWRW